MSGTEGTEGTEGTSVRYTLTDPVSGSGRYCCDVCGAMVRGDRLDRHSRWHGLDGTLVDARGQKPAEPKPEPKRQMNEQVRCPSPKCGWRKDTVGMAAYMDALRELNQHYVTAHVAKPRPPATPSHPVRHQPPSTDHTTAANRRGYASGMRWTCNRAGHPVDPTSFDGPAGERCICGTWAAGVEEGTIR